MKLGQGDEEHAHRTGTDYLRLRDKHGKYDSDKRGPYKPLPRFHSNHRKLYNLTALPWVARGRN